MNIDPTRFVADEDFFVSIVFKNDLFSPVGQKGWYIKDSHKAFFDQQPVDTASMV